MKRGWAARLDASGSLEIMRRTRMPDAAVVTVDGWP